MTEADLRALLDLLPATCAVCGAPGELGHVFVPGQPRDYGAPAGKVRVFLAWSCRPCAEEPERFELRVRPAPEAA